MQTFRALIQILLFTTLLSACRLAASPNNPLAAQPPTITASPTLTITPTVTVSPTLTPTPTVTPSPTPTFVPVDPTATLVPLSSAQHDEIFNRIWTIVRDNYVYEDYQGVDWAAVRTEFAPQVAAVTTTNDFYGLMREMILRLGDEHSRFESPQDVAEEESFFRGNLSYGGIGAIVRTVDEGGLIVSLAADGPAAEVGLQPRDLILAINSIPFTNTTAFGPAGPISAVRGEPGSTVQLTIRSTGLAPRDVEVTRRAIPSEAFPNVEAERLPNTNIGLLAIYTFNAENLDQHVREHLERLTEAAPLEGLIIDVRSNGGGRVDLLLNTLAFFIDGGIIGSQSGRDFRSDLTIPNGQTIPQLAEVPIVVLTTAETVSAAEMFAAGMQTLGRAQVVGTNTAGNTENLRPHNFSDGSRLWLAELTYRLPDDRLIEGQGVVPNREVDVAWWNYAPLQDPQIQAAITELRTIR